MLRIQTFHIFPFQSRTKQKVAASVLETRYWRRLLFLLFLPDPPTPSCTLHITVTCKSTVFDGSSDFHLGCCSLMWLYTECYMWRKVDEICTSAWTGFHLIWVLVAFRNMSALMYSIGMFVSMCLSIHIIWIVTNWRQQTQKAVDEADAHVSLTTLSGGVATWDICIDVIFFLIAVREDKLMATHKISVICDALFPPGRLTLDSRIPYCGAPGGSNTPF